MSQSEPEKPVLFSAERLSRYYGDFGALREVDLTVKEGEIVGLIGENGAGKSTLLKMIAGVEQPTAGQMFMQGRPYSCRTPLDANVQGVGMVFQEQALIRNLTVAQNIFLGREDHFRRHGVISWQRMNAAAARALAAIGMGSIPPEKKIWDLNFASRQMVEIAKVFDIVSTANPGESSLILLDEPTSVLNEAECQLLFQETRRLRDEGHAIIFVSHRLNEVLALTDRIYVFKDGTGAGEVKTQEADAQILYRMMVGHATTGQYYKTERQNLREPEVALRVRDISLKGIFREVTFDLHQGEVLGLCGVEGSGNEAVCSVICGDASPSSGTLEVAGTTFTSFANPAEALRYGILSIPKERREEGVIGILSIAENMIMSNLKAACSAGVLSNRRVSQIAREWVGKLRIKCGQVSDRIMRLSGGNAQKVVFARAMISKARILVLNHPTRGVDVGSKEEIYTLIRDMTNLGVAVIILGDTLDEYIGLSSRLLVMKDGQAIRSFDCPPDAKPEQVEIIKYMM
ncbi:MAG: sugar ABC transporter ATP-binding protein [Planctomycetota bacterium]|jgi:ribose transport system ATP-binding protein|nr:sugar ABC transporter ATP-binding protein [Planctomycetota bacterium]